MSWISRFQLIFSKLPRVSPQTGLCLCSGWLLATFLTALYIWRVNAWGIASEVAWTWWLCLAGGLELGIRISRRSPLGLVNRSLKLGVGLLTLAVGLWFWPSVWQRADTWLSIWGSGLITSPALEFLARLSWEMFATGLPAIVLGWLTATCLTRERSSDFSVSDLVSFIAGIIGCSLSLGLVLLPTRGLLFATHLGVCLAAVLALWELFRYSRSSSAIHVESHQELKLPEAGEWSHTRTLLENGWSVLLGSGFVLVTALFSQWWAETIYIRLLSVTGFCFGLVFGMVPLRWKSTPSAGNARLGLACTIALSVATVSGLWVGYEEMVYRLVGLNGALSQVWAQQLARLAIMILCLAPLGWSLGCLTRVTNARGGNAVIRWGLWLGIAVMGGLQAGDVSWPICAGIWLGAAVLHFVACCCHERSYFRVPGIQISAGLACVTCLLLLVTGGHYRPQLAARLLFSTQVFLADRAGIPRGQLAFLDEGRCLSEQASGGNIWTAWKTATARVQLRRNGLPAGFLSLDTRTVPQQSSEILTALVPLVLHPKAESVAILGLGSGVPLEACLGSPLLSVTCVENDRALSRMIHGLRKDAGLNSLSDDERCRLLNVDLGLWNSVSRDRCDVLIVNTPESISEGVSRFRTKEFYSHAGQHLSSEGIFCQRFIYQDFGPQALQDTEATLRKVFSHVMAMDSGAGEVVFVATNSPNGLIRPGLVERMQASHVRDLMSSVGWDWSVLLTLATYPQEAWEKASENSIPTVNTVANGQMTTFLPVELLRWGHKSQEVVQQLTANCSKLLNDVGESGADPIVLRRLAEVSAQYALQRGYPDQYWAYRNQVKKQVSRRPVTLIQQVSSEKDRNGLHPDDKQRIRYFQQLSAAIRGKDPVQIEAVNRFGTPFDPLVSYFLHQEIAEIYSGIPQHDFRAELTHRLYTMNYGHQGDRSVRNTLTALQIANEHPEIFATPLEQWDYLNALLQGLQGRWEAHNQAEPGVAKNLVRDIDQSLVTAEKCLVTLQALAPKVALSSMNWQARREAINRQLLRPLRAYRDQILPHIGKQAQAEAYAEGELPDDEDLQLPEEE